jgi:hypothetical protein
MYQTEQAKENGSYIRVAYLVVPQNTSDFEETQNTHYLLM